MFNYPISFSSKSLFNECRYRWADVYINGNRQPPGRAAQRGTALHDKLERFFLGNGYPRSDGDLAAWQPFMENLTQYSPVPECELAVDAKWQQTPYDAENAYARGKADLRFENNDTLYILDWKSGGIYADKHKEQGEMYVALSPERERYRTEFVYLDHPKIVHAHEYTHKERRTLVMKLIDEIETIRHATDFSPTPNSGCKWCPLSWRKGGSCVKAP